ncbi:MAG TPA: TonB family protein [Candidatus Sulfotelmatobacter sp.]|nr:TonB family protein [Candidatus Sulfotelmatobacter sp.]
MLVDVGAWREGAMVRGRYRVLTKIGEGGMGTVYKAEHVHFRELRALKVLRGDLANDPVFVSRFRQEAVISRKLQHPHAVKVEDIDEAEDGRPFIVMEFIEGRSLKDAIRSEAPMAVPRVCAILKQVAGALDAAHSLGIVHRDIKPANIVLIETAAGEQVKVLDFGIAKLKEGYLQDNRTQATLTGTGMVVGTPAYISPEQAVGKRGQELDGRSDLYSLAIVGFQMLTGDLPFKADSDIGFALAHLQTKPPSLRERRPDIAPEVADVVMSCLEKNPDLRPNSAKQLVQYLETAELLSVRKAFTPPAELPWVDTRKTEKSPTPVAVTVPQELTAAEQRATTLARSVPAVASRQRLLYIMAGVVLVALFAGIYYISRIPAPVVRNQPAPATQPSTNTSSQPTIVPEPSRAPEGKTAGAATEEESVSAPPTSTAKPSRMHVERGVSEGMLVKRVQPQYPPLARTAHVQGTVLLKARIDKDGNVESVELIRGHPLLVAAAIDAVKKWRYKPFLKNGKPISVETEIEVNFRLTAS